MKSFGVFEMFEAFYHLVQLLKSIGLPNDSEQLMSLHIVYESAFEPYPAVCHYFTCLV